MLKEGSDVEDVGRVSGTEWYYIAVLYFYEFDASCLHVLCMLNKKDHENVESVVFIVIVTSTLTGTFQPRCVVR